MPRGSRLRLVLGLAALPLAGALVRGAHADEPDPLASSVHALEDEKFAVRKAAERALYLEGSAILADLAAGDAAVDARIAAFERALGACELATTPSAAQAVARVCARLDEAASDAQVRRIPRLLRARLARLLPEVVVDRYEPGARADGARITDRSVRGLFPEARPVLAERIRTTDDPRLLAGALALLCAEDGSGPGDDADLELVAAAYEREPARFRDVFRFDSVVGAPPVMALALALVVTGRAAALDELSIREALRSESLRAWLEPRLERRGAADLAMGSFLVRLEEGRASADEEAEAARRALDAGVPWLARLLARRALFLAPASASARATLLAASTAVGIRTAARREGRPVSASKAVADPKASPDEREDDASAISIDDALRAGRLSQRLAFQVEAGAEPRAGLVAAAIGGGRLVHAAAGPRVRVVDAATGRERYTFPAPTRARARALALRGDELAEVTDEGALVQWSLGAAEATPTSAVRGAFSAVVAGRDGFWLAGFHLAIHRTTKDGVERVKEVAPLVNFSVRTLDVFRDDTLLVASGEAAFRIDPATGRASELELPDGVSTITAIAACGDDVLLAGGEAGELLRLDRGGRVAARTRLPDEGVILGLAAERDGSTAYVQTIDTLFALDPASGAVRWLEHVEGSGDPVVGGGLVAARAGRGGSRFGGDGRTDRTIYVLRATGTLVEPFGPAEHARIVSLATTAAAEGRPALARAVVDPVWTWLAAEERAAVEAAIDAAPERPADDGGRPR